MCRLPMIYERIAMIQEGMNHLAMSVEEHLKGLISDADLVPLAANIGVSVPLCCLARQGSSHGHCLGNAIH